MATFGDDGSPLVAIEIQLEQIGAGIASFAGTQWQCRNRLAEGTGTVDYGANTATTSRTALIGAGHWKALTEVAESFDTLNKVGEARLVHHVKTSGLARSVGHSTTSDCSLSMTPSDWS